MKTLALLALALALSGAARAADPDKVLITSPEATVTARDFEAQMLRIPDNLRQEARASLDRVATMSDTLFVNRVLAGEARKKGLLDDPLVATRTRQIVEAYEARVYLDDFEKNMPLQNIEARARELYLADRAKYRVAEQFALDHVLVNLWGRTQEMALARAKEARGKLVAGGVLEEVAKEYGTDPNQRTQPTGKLGIVPASQLDAAIGSVLPKLKVGEWSEPILTRAGYHLVRITAKTPARELSFDEVKKGLIEEERARFAKKLTDEKLQAIRNAPGARIDTEALKELVKPLPIEELNRIHREAAEAEQRARASGK
jgi:parvulin-like peptidyl-prolyl isomerase